MSGKTLVQICSYNSNMQGEAIAQDLVDWLGPTLDTAATTKLAGATPDIVVVGFQELLPLHLGFTGQSRPVVTNRDQLLKKAIEVHNQGTYTQIASIVNVGVAMLVYAKNDANGIAKRIKHVESQWSSFGPAFMGNKCGVAVRFRVKPRKEDHDGVEEVFTFVNTHLTAHAQHYKKRLNDYKHLVRTLLFKSVQPSFISKKPSTIYDTTHLFFFGDLNFRLAPRTKAEKPSFPKPAKLLELNEDVEGRRSMFEQYDQLLRAQKEGKALLGLREGSLENFKCSYKYKIGTVNEYSKKRAIAWTDRILYTTATDSQDLLKENGTTTLGAPSAIENVLYTSVPSFCKSDHKPITALLLVPQVTRKQKRLIALPAPVIKKLKLKPYPGRRLLSRLIGKSLDWVVGWVWFFLWLIGAGHSGVGIGNFVVGMSGWLWWRGTRIF